MVGRKFLGASHRAKTANTRILALNKEGAFKGAWQRIIINNFPAGLKPAHIRDFKKVAEEIFSSGAVRFVSIFSAKSNRNTLDIIAVYNSLEQRKKTFISESWNKAYLIAHGVTYACSNRASQMSERSLPFGFQTQHTDDNLRKRADDTVIDYASPYYADLIGLGIFFAVHLEHLHMELRPVIFPHQAGVFAGVLKPDIDNHSAYATYFSQKRKKRDFIETKEPEDGALISPNSIVFIDTFYGSKELEKKGKAHMKELSTAFNAFFFNQDTRKFLRAITRAFIDSDRRTWDKALSQYADIVQAIENMTQSSQWQQLKLPEDKQDIQLQPNKNSFATATIGDSPTQRPLAPFVKISRKLPWEKAPSL